jgi:Sigma-70 factor, region 1.2
MRTYDITPPRRSALTPPSVDAGLSRYLADIRKFPILAPEEELAYAKRWREYRDRDAAFQLVTSHLPASAAPFVALLSSALKTGDRAATTDVAKGPARIPESLRKEDGIADAA